MQQVALHDADHLEPAAADDRSLDHARGSAALEPGDARSTATPAGAPAWTDEHLYDMPQPIRLWMQRMMNRPSRRLPIAGV